MKVSVVVRLSVLLFLIAGALQTSGQVTRRVLFLGNSYTYSNNMPQLIADMAASTGKTLIFDSNTPGGYYLAQHLTNAVSLEKIETGNWDHVVLQDQSMALAYPSTFMNFLPYTIQLDSIIKEYNACAQTIFYATWGRKNGDQYWCTAPECPEDMLIERTYYEMDSTIEAHYKFFADSTLSSMTPVGAVWRHIRQNYPSIELFDTDGSHPSQAGSYAAACAFYTTIFRSDPTLIEFNSGLSPTDAINIKNAVKQIVYDNLLHWNVGVYDDLLDVDCLILDTGAESGHDLHWEVFPNPCANLLYVKLSRKNYRETISIYSNIGNLINQFVIEESTAISLEQMTDGIYFIRVTGSETTYKLMKGE